MKTRLANFELLRIIAMFMILVIHANMISLPIPVYSELLSSPFPVITRYFIESLGIFGVNIFVLISGWFTIKTRSKSFLAFAFQIIYILGGVFCVFLLLGKTTLSPSNILEIIAYNYRHWFVKSYIVLMILAPVLNTYVKNVTEKTQRYVLLGFFLFSSTYGWLGGARRFFVDGYGPLSFIGLYLLACYVRNCIVCVTIPKYLKSLLTFDKKHDLLIYLSCVFINTSLGVAGLYFNKVSVYGYVYAYTNPLTIIGSIYLLVFFSKLEIKPNKLIYTLASGSFAVYLFHSQIDVRPLFNQVVQFLFTNLGGVSCIMAIFAFLLLVYIVSVFIDLPRLWIWSLVSRKYKIQ